MNCYYWGAIRLSMNVIGYAFRAFRRLVTRGPIDTATYSFHVARNFLLTAFIDLWYGRHLCTTDLSSPGRYPGSYGIAHTSFYVLDALFSHVEVKPDDVLVDVGCGYGRILNYWLHRYPDNRIIGIEIDRDACKSLTSRYARYRNVRIVEGDATEVCTTGTILTLFNPFLADKMAAFADRVKPLNPTIIYYNYYHLEPFTDWTVNLYSSKVDHCAYRMAVIRSSP